MGIIDHKRPTLLSARVSRLLRSVLLASHELGHALAVLLEALQEPAHLLLEFRHAGLGDELVAAGAADDEGEREAAKK